MNNQHQLIIKYDRSYILIVI